MQLPTHMVVEWQVIIYSMLAIFFSGGLVFFAYTTSYRPIVVVIMGHRIRIGVVGSVIDVLRRKLEVSIALSAITIAISD